MNTLSRTIRGLALGATGLALAAQARAAELTLPRDGWVSWHVEAVADAPGWCCWSSLDAGNESPASCRLDRDSGVFGSRDDATTDAVRVYARLAAGKVQRLRTLSASCPVETATPIRDLGEVSTDDSAHLLVSQIKSSTEAKSKHELHDNVLAALAIHRGEVAQDALAAIARGDASLESRREAVFWLAHLRGVAGAEIVTHLMFADSESELREHAAFAITQSKSPRAAQDLIRLGNTDKDGEVRARAWFWLAHSGASESEAAIAAALRKEQDEQVREQAIFALSQLPEERATRALVATAEDRSLAHEQRKRAVFWLAQSESAAAQAYLAKVLIGNAVD